MFNRRDETGKLTWLFLLQLTTDDGLNLSQEVTLIVFCLLKKELSSLCRVSLKSTYEIKLITWKILPTVEKKVIWMEKLYNLAILANRYMCWIWQHSLCGWLQIIMYQNHVNNDAHRKVFVHNRKVDVGVLYTRKKR